jgi:hypothetical protein
MNPRAPLTVHIGALHLPGYSVRDGARLGGAFQRELGRALQGRGLPEGGLQQDLLNVQRFVRRAGERPEQTGRRLARAIARELLP